MKGRCNIKGIMFKPDMIEAITERRKTQTRRLDHLKEINQEPDKWQFVSWKSKHTLEFAKGAVLFQTHYRAERVVKPRYQVGEVVYIKEAYATENQYNGLKPSEIPHTAKLYYMLTDGYYPFTMGIRRTPMFMPAWAARYFIQITRVRAERLWNISEADILKEGCPQIPAACGNRIQWYQDLWDSINPKYPWANNDWVWVYSFVKVDRK